MRRIVFVAAWATLAGCGRVSDDLALQRTLVHEYHTDAIAVNVDRGSVLTITFTSSDATMLAGADRAAFARQVAQTVRDHYRAYANLQRITVEFPHTSHANQSYSFTRLQLGAPHTPARDRLSR
jgi:hypothetical protein